MIGDYLGDYSIFLNGYSNGVSIVFITRLSLTHPILSNRWIPNDPVHMVATNAADTLPLLKHARKHVLA